MERQIVFKEARLSLLLGFFLCWILFTSLFCSPAKLISLKYFYQHLVSFIWFLILLNFCEPREKIKIIIYIWVFSSTLACFCGIGQYLLDGIPYSTFGNKNIFSAFIVLTLPVITALLFNKKNSVLWCWAVIIHLLALAATDSRGALLGGLMGFFLFLLLVISRRKIIMGLCLGVSFLLIIVSFQGSLLDVFISDIRFFIWQGTWEMIKSSPFLGVGGGLFFLRFSLFCPSDYYFQDVAVDATRHAHNEFLQIWAETGIVGLILFLSVVVFFLYQIMYRVKREENREIALLIKGIISGLVALLVHNLLSMNFRMPTSFIWFYLILGLVYGCYTKKEVIIPHKRAYWFIFLYFLLFYFLTFKPLLAQYYFRKGVTMRSEQKLKEAVSCYQKALKWDPSSVRVQYRLAFTLAALKDYEGAYQLYDQIIRIAPGYASIFHNIGIVSMRQRKFQEAVDYFKRGLALNPYDLLSRQALISAYTELRRQKEAKIEVQRFIVCQRFLQGVKKK